MPFSQQLSQCATESSSRLLGALSSYEAHRNYARSVEWHYTP